MVKGKWVSSYGLYKLSDTEGYALQRTAAWAVNYTARLISKRGLSRMWATQRASKRRKPREQTPVRQGGLLQQSGSHQTTSTLERSEIFELLGKHVNVNAPFTSAFTFVPLIEPSGAIAEVGGKGTAEKRDEPVDSTNRWTNIDRVGYCSQTCLFISIPVTDAPALCICLADELLAGPCLPTPKIDLLFIHWLSLTIKDSTERNFCPVGYIENKHDNCTQGIRN